MKISRVEIENFRNFHKVDIELGEHAVIVGENKIGKTNFLFALRLLLDPSLPESSRQLHRSDFWDGIRGNLTKEDKIKISVEITDFENDDNLLAVLAEHIIKPEPMTAKLTYVFQPIQHLEHDPSTDDDYEFIVYGGDRPENRIGYDVRRRIPLTVISALRDAERDLSVWSKSPLKPLLDEAASSIEKSVLSDIATEVQHATDKVSGIPQINQLVANINSHLTQMVGSEYVVETALGFSPSDPDRLIRFLELFIDGKERKINEASLGTANLLYFALKTLELNQLVGKNKRDHTFLGIEEPEAHLHPHLQRLVYRNFLKPREHIQQGDQKTILTDNQTILLTTHSPHIVSVTPLRSIVLLKRSKEEAATEALSTANIDLTDAEVDDLERYLDITRGEILFAKRVILVEGEAEQYIVPILGEKLGYNFDELGITVCSVNGTNFLPYVKLLNCLGIPYALLTDLDPRENGSPLGHNRVLKLLEYLMEENLFRNTDKQSLLEKATEYGIFMNNYTFEIELFKSGRFESMCRTLIELTTNGAAKTRCEELIQNPDNLDEVRFLNDIEEIGKGRFAQRYASVLKKTPENYCPNYIREAIEHVIKC